VFGGGQRRRIRRSGICWTRCDRVSSMPPSTRFSSGSRRAATSTPTRPSPITCWSA
jgi:hypothetical protein